MSYPEHEKLHAVAAETQAAGAFIEWLESEGIVLCEIFEADGYRAGYVHTPKPLLELLAAWKGIDRHRLEDEKCRMLDEQRALNEARGR